MQNMLGNLIQIQHISLLYLCESELLGCLPLCCFLIARECSVDAGYAIRGEENPLEALLPMKILGLLGS